jgi:hypothetical protein
VRTVTKLAVLGSTALLHACGDAESPTPPESEPVVLGTVERERSVPCPSVAAPGARCAELSVVCPALDALSVVVVTTDPIEAPSRATVLLHDYVGGTELFDDGFVAGLRTAGFRVVQAKWQSDWQAGHAGLRHAACRIATLLSWTHANVHEGDRTRGFCAQSYGGGAGGLAFALAHYGSAQLLDAVTLSGGPPFARVDLGCDPTTPPRGVCAGSPPVPIAYAGGPLAVISKWEEAPACGTERPPPADVMRWQRDSILSEGAQLSFPKTSVAAWYCDVQPDATVGQGSLFLDAIASERSLHCVVGCSDGRPWQSSLDAMVADMRARCIPRHGP